VVHKALLLAAPLALAALRGPSCGSDTPASGPNAPCTRSSDCENALACQQGVCVTPDGAPPLMLPARPPDSGAADGTDID
jgi:hypothetical protein